MRIGRGVTRFGLVSAILGGASLGLLGTCGSAPAAPPTAPIAYTISPKLDAGNLVGVVVEVALPIGPTGEAILELPEEWGGTDKLYRYLSPIAVTGGSITTLSPTERKVVGTPGRSVMLRYVVFSAYDHEPNAKDSILTDGPM